MPDSAVYEELNRRWKSTCKVLLGDEVGDLRDYEDWLSKIFSPKAVRKSKSGKEVVLALPHYSTTARFLSFDEVNFMKDNGPLSINEIKDIDSIIGALGEKIQYTGNIVLGTSKFVEKSTGVIDSFYAYESERMAKCKYIAYGTETTASECVFGSNGFGATTYSIRVFELMYSSRCFESSKIEYSTDVYFSHGLANCQNAMFCFNLRSGRNCIGNLPLPPDKYLKIKTKLLGEIREELKKKKRLPSLLELGGTPVQNKKEIWAIVKGSGDNGEEKPDRNAIEDAFSATTKLVFEKPYGNIDKFGKWLGQYAGRLEKSSSSASDRPLLAFYKCTDICPTHRLVTQAEAFALGEKLRMSEKEVESLALSNVPEAISRIAFFSSQWDSGKLRNIIESVWNFDSSNCYRAMVDINSKYCAYCYWPRDSEYMFGGNEVRDSTFCINCYHSAKLQRCFEVDSSRGCSDCFFCHNCENVHDSMFCFNVKNLKNAIANVELPRERYLEIKKRVLAELNGELSRTNSIALSIFNLAEKRKE